MNMTTLFKKILNRKATLRIYLQSNLNMYGIFVSVYFIVYTYYSVQRLLYSQLQGWHYVSYILLYFLEKELIHPDVHKVNLDEVFSIIMCCLMRATNDNLSCNGIFQPMNLTCQLTW